MKRQYENKKQKCSCVKESILIMEMHLSIFNNEIFCLHQTDKKFKSICNNTKSKGNFTSRNNCISSAKKNFRELRKLKSLPNE